MIAGYERQIIFIQFVACCVDRECAMAARRSGQSIECENVWWFGKF